MTCSVMDLHSQFATGQMQCRALHSPLTQTMIIVQTCSPAMVLLQMHAWTTA